MKEKIKKVLVILILILSAANLKSQTFFDFLSQINATPESERPTLIDSFMNVVSAFPYIEQDTLAHFIYRGNASSATVPGDANSWNTSSSPMIKIAGTNFWYCTEVFENDARLDYKFFVNGNWILDPRNPNTCTRGYEPNSELRMPAYQMPTEIAYYRGIAHGTLKDTTFFSVNPGNSRSIRVYLPPGYDNSTVRYPMILFHDGLEYVTLASANNVLDYLIHHQRIKPTIAVFVPIVNRTSEYGGNLQNKFTKFIIDEIIPWVDARFRTIPVPEKRAVLGVSYGGNISLGIGLNHPNIFGNVAAQSSYIQGLIFSGFQSGSKLNLKINMILGTYDITSLIPLVRSFIPILDAKGYAYQYREYHEGHSWGFWRAHIDDALEMFFPFQPTAVKSGNNLMPDKFKLLQYYPNPFNSETLIRFFVDKEAFISIKIFNITVQTIRTLIAQQQLAGSHSVIWYGKDDFGKPQSSGIYFCQLMVDGFPAAVRRMVLLR
jgi:enterochelin esterase-like enzyme